MIELVSKYRVFQVAVHLESGVSGDVISNDDVRVECRSLKLFLRLVCDVQTIVVNYLCRQK